MVGECAMQQKVLKDLTPQINSQIFVVELEADFNL